MTAKRGKDFWGVGVSLLCIAHCLATPLIVAAIPALAAMPSEAPASEPAVEEGCECCSASESPGESAAVCSADGCRTRCPAPWICRGLSLLAVVVGVWALLPGYRRHRRVAVLAVGVAGLALLGASGFFADRLPWPGLERPVMVGGGVLLIAAHLGNRRLVGCCPACPGPTNGGAAAGPG